MLLTMNDYWENSSVFEGRLVRLRGMSVDDWPLFHQILLDSEASRGRHMIPLPPSPEATKEYISEQVLQRYKNDEGVVAVENKAGEFVGFIRPYDCDRRAGTFSVGGGGSREHWRKGYAFEAFFLLLRFFFNELRYQKATIYVSEVNEPSIELNRKLGFSEEGRLRRMIFMKGRYFDDLVFGMTVEEFLERESDLAMLMANGARGSETAKPFK